MYFSALLAPTGWRSIDSPKVTCQSHESWYWWPIALAATEYSTKSCSGEHCWQDSVFSLCSQSEPYLVRYSDLQQLDRAEKTILLTEFTVSELESSSWWDQVSSQYWTQSELQLDAKSHSRLAFRDPQDSMLRLGDSDFSST